MMGTSGQLRLKLSDDEDYITNLPENLISQILSLLPTKDAVRTSILSKDWVYKWTSVDNVDINDDQMASHKELFVKFMDSIRIGSSLSLTRFRLKCREVYGLTNTQRWISTALRHNLEILEIRCHENGLVLPCRLVNSTSSQKLFLALDRSFLNVASRNCAPNLTCLTLSGVKIVNEDPNTSSMTFDFPLLQSFCTVECEWSYVESVELYTPSLTTFWSSASNEHVDYGYSFVIHAPRLAKFKCHGAIPEKINVIYRSSIVSARLSFFCDEENLELLTKCCSRIGKMFNGFTNLLKLKIWVPLDVSLSELSLQPHGNLRELDIYSDTNAEQLLALLHVSPSLKVLKICLYDWVDYDYGGIPTVPSCIVTHLEEIEFTGFECETSHYNLLMFLLKNGEQLKKITFADRPDLKHHSGVIEYISAFRNVDIV